MSREKYPIISSELSVKFKRSLPMTIIIILVFSLVFSSCERFIINLAPKQKNIKSKGELAEFTDTYFWETFHNGNYNEISKVVKLYDTLFILNPEDGDVAARLGFLHTWNISERNRLEKLSPNILDDVLLANQYFAEAVKLEPKNPLYWGFYGVITIIEGGITDNQRKIREGYFLSKDAIKMWPEFNYFSLSYIMSTLDYKNKQFSKAVEWQWTAIDICNKGKIDRDNPDIEKFVNIKYSRSETQLGDACGNTWEAPHNVEGFLFFAGDLMVKNGESEKGLIFYQGIKKVKDYKTWPFHDLLNERIKNAGSNVANFRKVHPKDEVVKEPIIVSASQYSCVLCHQTTDRDHGKKRQGFKSESDL